MKRPSCLYIHIGPHKTGSSAIQLMCDENRAIFAERGILYPQGRWHGQLGSYFARNKMAYVYNQHSGNISLTSIQASDAHYMKLLTRELTETECDKAVVSYEGFIGLSIGELADLRDFMKTYFDEFRVLGYCRHPLSFAPSEISQRARMGVPTGRQDITNLPIPRFRDYFEKFVSVFGVEQVSLTEFAPHALYKNDVRLDLLKTLDIGDPDEISLRLSEDHANESLSFEAVIIAEALARQMSPSTRANVFFLKYNKLLSSIKGVPVALTKDECHSIMNRAQPHLEYIDNTFGIKFSPLSYERSHSEVSPFGSEAIDSIAHKLCNADMVSQGFRWLLGREPESEDVIFGHLQATGGDQGRLRTHIMQSPEFIRKAVSTRKDRQNPANRVSIITTLFASLYENDAFDREDFIRFYLAYCYKNRSYLQKGELALAVDLMIRHPEMISIIFDEMTRHGEWAALAQSLRTIGEAVKSFRNGEYDEFETLLCNIDWPSIDLHRQAVVSQTSVIEYMRTLKPPLAKLTTFHYTNVQDEICGFYKKITASCFVDSLLKCVIQDNKLAAFTSCDLTYYSAFADTLAHNIENRASVFLVIILCCRADEVGIARKMATRFNEKFAQTALTILQVHDVSAVQRSFYTAPRLLALAVWLCTVGREGISIDIDVLCGPKFDQPAEEIRAGEWDVMLPIKPDGWPWSKIFAAYIRVKPTSAGREFATGFVTYLLQMVEPSRYQWHIDQNSLVAAYIRGLRQEDLQIYDILNEFKEVIFTPGPGGLDQKIKDIEKRANAPLAQS